MESDVLEFKRTATEKSEKNGNTSQAGYLSLEEENSDCGEVSDELFSDTDDKKGLKYYSPNPSNTSDFSFLNSSATPLLQSNWQTTTPSTSVVPSTPLGLIPFLNRHNEQWTSDLETPQTDKTSWQYKEQSVQKPENASKNTSLRQCTPKNSDMESKDNECISSSPILNTKRVRLRPKRRIFKSVISADCQISALNKNDKKTEDKNVVADDDISWQQDNVSNTVQNENLTSIIPKKRKAIFSPDIFMGQNAQHCFTNASLSNNVKTVSANSQLSNKSKLCTNIKSLQSRERQFNEIQDFKETGQNDEIIVQRKFCAQNLGFQTAGGRSVNISKKALEKAKTLFSEEVAELRVETETQNEHRVENKQMIESEMQLRDIGFQTAGGRSVNISKKALEKAKTLFSEEVAELQVETETQSEHRVENKQIIGSEMKPHDIGFQTAGGRSVNISKKALEKAKTLFSEEVAELQVETETQNEPRVENKQIIGSEMKQHDIGFQTAGGRSVNISKKALEKAKTLFSEEVAELQVETETQNEPRVENKQMIESEMQLHHIGFQTAGGRSVNVSKEALERAKIILTDNSSEADFKTHNFNDKIVPISSVERDINVSSSSSHTPRRSLSKEISQFRSETSTLNKAQTVKKDDESKNQVQSMGFQTATGQHINVSHDALLKARSLFDEETLEDSRDSSPTNHCLKKRKDRDWTGDISANKSATPQFKKLRFNNESRPENLIRDIKADTSMEDIKSMENKVHDKNYIASEGPSISSEIVASAAALLADEKSSVVPEEWTLQEEDNEKEANACSPVIGRKSITRKRKSTNARKRKLNLLNNNEGMPLNSPNGESNIFQTNTFAVAAGTSQDDVVFHSPSSVIPNSCDKQKQKQTTEEKLSVAEKQNSASTNEYGDTQLMLDFLEESANILEKRLTEAIAQDKAINLKKRKKPKPVTGRLFSYKNSNSQNRLTWKQISGNKAPVPKSCEELIAENLAPEIFDITPATAEAYRFRCADFYGQDFVQTNTEGIKVGDGACLILDENGYVGISEMRRSFLASPGVDPNLIPIGWTENHYRWIVWKLASMDRMRFSSDIILPRSLTPDTVMAQLKYRYDREIDRSQRSALRKILEKDDVASKRMVLCVSSIVENNDVARVDGSPKPIIPNISKKLILTDGWYSIYSSIDQAMMKYIETGKLKVGTKIMTYGAELLNSDQGCSPLEVPESICLKIHTNSTRRARWDAKLGYIAPPGPMKIRLKHVLPSGGIIAKIIVQVVRVYPMLYHEKTGGESIFRNARCEEKASMAYEKECRSKAETFYANAEKYFQDGKRSSNETDSIGLLAVEYNENRDKLLGQDFLSRQEREELLDQCRMKEEELKRKLESRLQENLPPPRKVTPLLKVRTIEGETSAVLSVWSPNEEILNILKEGNYLSICKLSVSGLRNGELQLTAGRNAIFNLKSTCSAIYPHREFTPMNDIGKITFNPPYGEFDTAGIVVSIGNGPYGMKNFEAVYLACPHTNSSQSSYLAVLFWNGMAAFGYAEILSVGSIITCANLTWRKSSSWSIPMAYCTERTTFSRNSRQSYFLQAFKDLKSLVTDTTAYVEKCSTEVSEELKKRPSSKMSDGFTPDKKIVDQTISNDDSNKKRTVSPSENTFQQSFMFANINETRSDEIQKRLDKLVMYENPPKLSPVVLNNSSNRVLSDFQSPVRSSNPKSRAAQVNRKLSRDFQ